MYAVAQNGDSISMRIGRSPQDIGWRIIVTREALGMSQADLARATEFDPPRVNNWEKGNSRPDLDGGHTLADVLGVTLDWIYRGDLSRLPMNVLLFAQAAPDSFDEEPDGLPPKPRRRKRRDKAGPSP